MEDRKRIFTEVIKRQMAILGPDITLAKVKNVSGIKVDDSGQVISITGDPQFLLSELINQFVELSGLIVKKTMESILMSRPDSAAVIGMQVTNPPQAPTQSKALGQPVIETPVETVTPTAQDKEILSANKDIEDLNKMLNNLNQGNSK